MQIHEPVALFSLTYTRNLITSIFPSFKFVSQMIKPFAFVSVMPNTTIKVAKAPLQTMENIKPSKLQITEDASGQPKGQFFKVRRVLRPALTEAVGGRILITQSM